MLIRWLGLIVSIHENILLRRMAMHVTEEKYVSALKGFLHHELGMIKHWILFAAWAYPLSVQVLTDK